MKTCKGNLNKLTLSKTTLCSFTVLKFDIMT